MQHITIRPMTVSREYIEQRRRINRVALAFVAAVLLCADIVAAAKVLSSMERRAEIAARV
jgi:hypothetical protein